MEEGGSAALRRPLTHPLGEDGSRSVVMEPEKKNPVRSETKDEDSRGGAACYYGDCVAGLLWAELGDRLGLQLPGGAPLGRLPAAPLSRPSEFSSIS